MNNVYNVRREAELGEDETRKMVEQMFEVVMQVDKARIFHSDINVVVNLQTGSSGGTLLSFFSTHRWSTAVIRWKFLVGTFILL